MSKVTFVPSGTELEVAQDTKILIAARQGKVALRYGCAACSCGTCAVKIAPPAHTAPMKDKERALLTRMKLAADGTIRLSCQARITGDILVDVSFQDSYSPDAGDDF